MMKKSDSRKLGGRLESTVSILDKNEFAAFICFSIFIHTVCTRLCASFIKRYIFHNILHNGDNEFLYHI